MGGIPQQLFLIFVAGFLACEISLPLRLQISASSQMRRLAFQLAVGLGAALAFEVLSAFLPLIDDATIWVANHLNAAVSEDGGSKQAPIADMCPAPLKWAGACILVVPPADGRFLLVPNHEHLGAILLVLVIAEASTLWVHWRDGWRPWPDEENISKPGDSNRYAIAKLKYQVRLGLAGPMYETLVRSMLDQRNVMVTLDNGKVYVGLIANLPTYAEVRLQTGACRIVPIMSGYRDEKHKVHFTTFYDEVRGSTNMPQDFLSVGFWFSSLKLITYFDFEVYDRFNPPDPPSNAPVAQIPDV